jgi:hypothetical protein
VCNIGCMRDADLPVMLSYPYSSEPAKNVKNSGIKMGDCITLKSHTSRFMDFKTVLYVFFIVILILLCHSLETRYYV